MIDSFTSAVSYIRIGVTPRLSLSQSYKVTREGKPLPNGGNLLSINEIARLARIYASAGLRKIRLTGGEPLMRDSICSLIKELKQIDGIEEVAISTNGILLPKMMKELRESGLDAISISLESLRSEKLDKIAGNNEYSKIMSVIQQIVEDDIWPLTINVVAIRGVNNDEILDFAEMAYTMPIDIRFIEMMPEDFNGDFHSAIPFYMDEVEQELTKRYTLIPIEGRAESAQDAIYMLKGGEGRIRMVSPVSSHSCEKCNRLRITADGRLRTCLFDDHDIDLRRGFRNGENDEWFLEMLRDALKTKPFSNKPDHSAAVKAVS